MEEMISRTPVKKKATLQTIAKEMNASSVQPKPK
jgi:hypothetical protein